MTYFRRVLLFLVVFPLLVSAQQHGSCEQRSFAVNVVDAHGQQILGLTSERFRATFQGQPVRVLSAGLKAGLQRIFLLLDVSGSMWADAQQRELVKLVAGDLVSAGPQQAQLALATFSSKVETKVRFGQERGDVCEAILGLNPPSKSIPGPSDETALNDAILEAANMFGSPQPGDVIYAITDGLDNESKTSTGRVIEYLGQRNIRLFVTVVRNGRFVQFSTRPASGAELVGSTAKKTGGSYTILETDRPWNPGAGASTNGVRQLYDLMASFYLLEIKLPKEPEKPTELKLAAVDANGKKEKGLTVLYPQNISPCAVPQ